MSPNEWTAEWPTEPGWYWTWDPNTSRRPEPGRVMLLGPKSRRSTLHFVGGAPTNRDRWPSLLWGPRIEVPDAPDGTPGTRYAVAMVCDQTITYLAEDGSETIQHPKAEVFMDRRSAEGAMDAYRGRTNMPPCNAWVEAIDDLDEFRTRGDTW